jgi:hypothetical protein
MAELNSLMVLPSQTAFKNPYAKAGTHSFSGLSIYLAILGGFWALMSLVNLGMYFNNIMEYHCNQTAPVLMIFANLILTFIIIYSVINPHSLTTPWICVSLMLVILISITYVRSVFMFNEIDSKNWRAFLILNMLIITATVAPLLFLILQGINKHTTTPLVPESFFQGESAQISLLATEQDRLNQVENSRQFVSGPTHYNHDLQELSNVVPIPPKKPNSPTLSDLVDLMKQANVNASNDNKPPLIKSSGHSNASELVRDSRKNLL